MQPTENARQRAYPRRLVAKGRAQVLADLRCEDIAFLDKLKERQGLRNRGQVLEQLNEIGRTVTQQQIA